MLNNTHIEYTPMNNVLSKIVQISFPYIVVVSLLGIGGNFLTIIMLSAKSISKNFNNCTLIALALTDLLFNFALVSRYINDLTQSNNERICRLLSFLSHLAELLSACFTAQFTAQRFIAVRFPLSVFIEKKIHLIHYFIVTLFIILGVVYCLGLVKANAYDNCHEELDLNWFISDALLSFLIPFAIISILNILIIFYLKKRFQHNQQYRFTKRQQQSETTPLNFLGKPASTYELEFHSSFHTKIYDNVNLSNSRSSIPPTQNNSDQFSIHGRARSLDLLKRPTTRRSKSQSYRVTRMLILVSTCFLLLNAPVHICTIGLKIYLLQRPILLNDTHEIFFNFNENYKPNHENLSIILNTIDHSHITLKTLSAYDNINNFRWMESFYIVVVIAQHISYASYSINFFLYSFCGIKFRSELLRCMSTNHRQMPASRSITV